MRACVKVGVPAGLFHVPYLSDCHWFFCLIVIHYANEFPPQISHSIDQKVINSPTNKTSIIAMLGKHQLISIPYLQLSLIQILPMMQCISSSGDPQAKGTCEKSYLLFFFFWQSKRRQAQPRNVWRCPVRNWWLEYVSSSQQRNSSPALFPLFLFLSSI